MSADVGDGWEVVTKDPFAANRKAPALTIYEDGTGHLSAVADRALDQPDAVQFLANPHETKVGITAADADDELDTFSVTRSGNAGGDVRPRKALHRVGVDVEALSETVKLPLETVDDMLVADCSELLTDDDSAATRTGDRDLDATTTAADDEPEEDESATTVSCDSCDYVFDDQDTLDRHRAETHGDVDAAEDDEDEQEGVACRYPDCDRVFGGENGRNIHEGQKHGGMWEGSEDHGDTEVPDPDDAPAPKVTRDCAESVDTIQELADLMDLSAPEARFAAREADVYADLQDRPPRPGVDR